MLNTISASRGDMVLSSRPQRTCLYPLFLLTPRLNLPDVFFPKQGVMPPPVIVFHTHICGIALSATHLKIKFEKAATVGFKKHLGHCGIVDPRFVAGSLRCPKSQNLEHVVSRENRARGRTLQGGVLGTFWEPPSQNPFPRTLFYCKTHSRPPSQNPSENPSPEPFPRTFSEPFLARYVAVRPLRRAPKKILPKFRSRPRKPNQRKGQNEKFMIFFVLPPMFVNSGVFPWENKRDSYRTFVPVCPREKFMNCPFFGLVCRGDS